jgi:hypothetical protein
MEVFKNKVVSFSAKDSVLALKNPFFVEIKNRLFVCGQIPKKATNNDWAKNKKGYIAWDEVSDFIIFESEQDYIKRMKKSEK